MKNILPGIPSPPWDGIHRRKSRSFFITILASSYLDIRNPKMEQTHFVKNRLLLLTQCSALTWKMTNVFCIGTNGPQAHASLPGGLIECLATSYRCRNRCNGEV